MDFKKFYKHLYFDIDSNISSPLQPKQGDTDSRGFYITVLQDRTPVVLTNETMTFFAEKPDDTRVFIDAVKENGIFRIDLTNQVFAAVGDVKCELVLKGSNGEKIASKTFIIRVGKSLHEGSVISTNERGMIDEILSISEELLPLLEEIDLEAIASAIDDLNEALSSESARIASEIIRVANETNRIALYNDISGKLSRGELKGDIGPKGDKGDKGDTGAGLNILGTFEDETELPGGGSVGDAYIIDGDLWVWESTSFINVGNIKGPKGEQGIQGLKGDKPNHEWNGTSLRVEKPDGTWGTYVDLKGSTGEKGDKPGHQWVEQTKLQFQNPNGTWGTAVDLEGKKGDTGQKGDPPEHRWVDDTKLQIQNPNGTWGTAVDLEGKKGDTGDIESLDAQLIIDALGYIPLPISGGILENYSEKVTTVTASGGSINLSLGNVFQHTPSGNITYSITNAVNGQAHSFTLIINMGSTVRTLTFPSSVKWQGGEIPDLSTASKTYVLTFMTIDGGTTWLGMFGGEF